MWLNAVIIASYILCSVLTYETARDIIPMIAAVLCALGILQKKTSNYRVIMFLNGATWIVYDVIIAAYTMLLSHIFTSGSALLGIIRLDILKKDKK